MKKTCIIGLLAGICGLANVVSATTIITPTVSGQDYSSLVPANAGYSHAFEYGHYYEWGINLANGTQLTAATVTVNATLYNTTTGTLFVSLLDQTAVTGITQTSYSGETKGGPDYFANKTGFVDDTSKSFTKGQPTTMTFTLTADDLTNLNAYLAGQTATYEGFDIGFDPHCTYAVSSLSITYSTPDAATTVLLLGASLMGLEVFRRKFVPAKMQA